MPAVTADKKKDNDMDLAMIQSQVSCKLSDFSICKDQYSLFVINIDIFPQISNIRRNFEILDPLSHFFGLF